MSPNVTLTNEMLRNTTSNKSIEKANLHVLIEIEDKSAFTNQFKLKLQTAKLSGVICNFDLL